MIFTKMKTDSLIIRSIVFNKLYVFLNYENNQNMLFISIIVMIIFNWTECIYPLECTPLFTLNKSKPMIIQL